MQIEACKSVNDNIKVACAILTAHLCMCYNRLEIYYIMLFFVHRVPTSFIGRDDQCSMNETVVQYFFLSSRYVVWSHISFTTYHPNTNLIQHTEYNYLECGNPGSRGESCAHAAEDCIIIYRHRAGERVKVMQPTLACLFLTFECFFNLVVQLSFV